MARPRGRADRGATPPRGDRELGQPAARWPAGPRAAGVRQRRRADRGGGRPRRARELRRARGDPGRAVRRIAGDGLAVSFVGGRLARDRRPGGAGCRAARGDPVDPGAARPRPGADPVALDLGGHGGPGRRRPAGCGGHRRAARLGSGHDCRGRPRRRGAARRRRRTVSALGGLPAGPSRGVRLDAAGHRAGRDAGADRGRPAAAARPVGPSRAPAGDRCGGHDRRRLDVRLPRPGAARGPVVLGVDAADRHRPEPAAAEGTSGDRDAVCRRLRRSAAGVERPGRPDRHRVSAAPAGGHGSARFAAPRAASAIRHVRQTRRSRRHRGCRRDRRGRQPRRLAGGGVRRGGGLDARRSPRRAAAAPAPATARRDARPGRRGAGARVPARRRGRASGERCSDGVDRLAVGGHPRRALPLVRTGSAGAGLRSHAGSLSAAALGRFVARPRRRAARQRARGRAASASARASGGRVAQRRGPRRRRDDGPARRHRP